MKLLRNISDAENLFDLGQAVTHNEKCGCHECVLNLQAIKEDVKSWVIELAQMWYKASPGLQFQGLLEEWNEETIAEKLNFTIPEKEAA